MRRRSAGICADRRRKEAARGFSEKQSCSCSAKPEERTSRCGRKAGTTNYSYCPSSMVTLFIFTGVFGLSFPFLETFEIFTATS